MARGLVWSPEAVEDIEAIARFIERDSVWHARAVASKIVETAETIQERVLIAGVIHGSRLLQPFAQRIQGRQTSSP